MSDRPTPETDAAERMAYSQEYMVQTDFARCLKRERDEARAVAHDLASAASHCLGWHDCRLRIGEKITATLQRWRSMKGEQ